MIESPAKCKLSIVCEVRKDWATREEGNEIYRFEKCQ